MTVQEEPSLHDRLGGVYNIATVVEDHIDRVMVDARLNANPRVDEAHHRVSAAGFKYYVTEMACLAAGGLNSIRAARLATRTAISRSPRRSGERSWMTFSKP